MVAPAWPTPIRGETLRLGATGVATTAAGFPEGYWNAANNRGARLLSMGGICEDAMSGYLSGISTFGRHVGVGSSYGAFMAPLGHIAARLHAIGNEQKNIRALFQWSNIAKTTRPPNTKLRR